jgi:type II secretory pathway pseudopilin PulG
MKKIKAFTLIETLVAIIVFCIGILTVLLWLSQTLRNKDYATTQIKSAFFAREWIELVFNLRDANYHKELPWNCIFKPNPTGNISIKLDDNGNEISNSACNWYLKPWTVLKIWIWSENEYIHVEEWQLANDFDKDFENFQIYFHTWVDNWFLYDYKWNDDEKTWFARYLTIETVKWINSDDNLLKVISHVLYQRWTLTWEKVMETFIWNYNFEE